MGYFITLEGCEGSGKTTQGRLLLEYFQSINRPAVLTKEPGGTELANKIRAILLSDLEIEDALTEFLLLSAARRDHVINFIKPELDANKIVICDRFFDSSFVYQGYYKSLNLDFIRSINLSVSPFVPDITLLLDLAPTIAQIRLMSRSAELNHYDNKGLAFQTIIRNGFLDVAKQSGDRIKIIDASKGQKEVFADIISVVNNAHSGSKNNRPLRKLHS